jgi:hypothetical protein
LLRKVLILSNKKSQLLALDQIRKLERIQVGLLTGMRIIEVNRFDKHLVLSFTN